jgi:hypothetical protein
LSSERLKGIWPLPGGWNNYVQTLKKILGKVNKENPTMTQMFSWLKDEYGLSGKASPFGYLRVVKDCLGFLDEKGGRLEITATARQFLTTEDNKLVLDILRKRVLGFEETLSILSGGQRLDLLEFHRELVERCKVDWEKPTQAMCRLNWLASLGYVDKEHGKYYLIEKGPIQPPPLTPIDDYIKHAESLIKRHPTMSELNTISTLIEPFLEVLGWNIRDPDEVQRGYPIRIGDKTEYVDIALKINNRPVVFIEAKAVDTPLQDHLAEQPIKYANAEGVSWCVLTNGRELGVYNAFWKIKGIEQKTLLKLSIADFKEKTDKLLLLSKDKVISGKLDEEGEFEHAKRIILEWLRLKESNVVRGIMELDPSLKEDYVRRVLRKIL